MMRMWIVDFKGLVINVAGCGGLFLFFKMHVCTLKLLADEGIKINKGINTQYKSILLLYVVLLMDKN